MIQDNLQLINAYYSDRTTYNLHKLVEYYLPYVKGIVIQYVNKYRDEDFDEVFQNACLIFLETLLVYDPKYKTSLALYCYCNITHRLIQFYRDEARYKYHHVTNIVKGDEDDLLYEVPYTDRTDRDIDPRIQEIKEVCSPFELKIVKLLLNEKSDLTISGIERKHHFKKRQVENTISRLKLKILNTHYNDTYVDVEYQKKYYKQNREKINNYNREYYKKHRKKILAQIKKRKEQYEKICV